MDYDALADLARPALIIAAARRSLVTYGELARAIGFPKDTPPSHHMKRILDRLSDRCTADGEPSLAVLVVAKDTGQPGSGFDPAGGTWHAETQRCFRHWAAPA